MKVRIKKLLLALVLVILTLGLILTIVHFIPNSEILERDEAKHISYRPPATASEFLSQAGTEADPYVVASAQDMKRLALEVANGNMFSGKVFIVASGVSEITLGDDYVPIGTNVRPFAGTFDGFGVNFQLNINYPEVDHVGLFGFVQGGVIENLSVSGNVRGKNNVGGIVGYLNTGTVRNVYSTANVEGIGQIGGLIGYLREGTLTSAYNLGNIKAQSSGGGLVGYSMLAQRSAYSTYHYNTISNAYSAGKVQVSGANVGGVIGYDNPTNYSGGNNTRSNIYYDISVNTMFDPDTGYKKPSSLASTAYALNSEVLMSGMSTRLSNTFSFSPIGTNYGYYPELIYFKEHANTDIVARSIDYVTTDISNGVGTQARPFLIRTNQDIQTLKTKILLGNTFEGFHFKVQEGRTVFNLGETTPIGNNAFPFYGSFDGNFANFNVSIIGEAYTGLFGYFGKGTIKNLYVTGSITGTTYVGGVVGYKVSGLIQNVYNAATISGTTQVGGIVGRNQLGNIETSFNNAKVFASTSYAGGILGYLYEGTVQNVYNHGEILSPLYAGGIAGGSMLTQRSTYDVYHYNAILNSYNSGLVSANSYANGIVGYDNPQNYSGGNNQRTNTYYDTSILATYDQPYALKPAVIGNTHGKTSDFLLYDSLADNLKFDTNIWKRQTKTATTAYYPQLIVFADNSITSIKNEAIKSTSLDISYGLGTKEIPFLIKTAEDMHELSRKVLAGNPYKNYFFKVDEGVTELYLGNFIPIGNNSNYFQGTFNGNGVNFIVDINTTQNYVGIFGALNNQAVIENFSVSGSIIGGTYVGAAAGYVNTATVRNIYNTADISGVQQIGGLIGQLYIGTLTNGFNLGSITGNNYVGGIVGYSMLAQRSAYSTYHSNNINNVYSAGKVSVLGSNYTGGAIGYDNPTNYSGGNNPRTNIYYDITVIANYEQAAGYSKPSSLKSASYAMDSGELFTKMSGKFGAGWYLKEKDDTYAYYPQLEVFSSHVENHVKTLSETSVKVDVSLGMGTSELPFIINTIDDINQIRQKVADGNTFEGFYFKVNPTVKVFDIGAYEPIGSNTRPFYGSFDGSFVEFKININNNAPYQGLFGYFGKGTIQNLYVSGSVTGTKYVGAVVGYKVSGLVKNVYNLATVTGTTEVGGIVGRNQSSNIEQAYNDASVFASTSYAGGIVGYLYEGIVSDTYNHGEILAVSSAGGIAGGSMLAQRSEYSTYHYNTIKNSYSSGLVSANTNAGGIVGYDNPQNYSGGNNGRTNVYYDTSVLVSYDQPYTLKPAVIGHTYGKTSDFLLYDPIVENLKYDSTIWYRQPRTSDYGYYPQLRVFAFNQDADIKLDNIASTIKDVSGGLGTQNDPFLIKNADDMHELSRMVNEGNSYKNYYFKVDDGISELDLGNFIPIGTTNYKFQGTFNGNGVNFIVNIETSINNVGIFGAINNGAIIENFSIDGSVIGASNTGGIVGYIDTATVRNVYNMADIKGTSNVGGIVGQLYIGTVTNAFNLGTILGNTAVGGVVGYSMRYQRSAHSTYHTNNINNTYSAGKVAAVGSGYVGGVVGYDNPAVYSGSANPRTNNYYDITVTASYDQPAGYTKPSSLKSATYAMESGELFTKMSGKFGAGWYLKEKDDIYAYYPQLTIFSNHDLAAVKTFSNDNVKVDVKDGIGNSDFPFLIRTKQDLDSLRQKVKDGNTFEGFYFKVDDDITKLELGEYESIGTASRPFYGSFDGNFAEFNIEINTTTDYQGLFGYFGKGVIQNLSVSGNITGGNYTGAVVGYKISGNVINVYNLADVKGVSQVGGVVGRNVAGNISSVYNYADVFATTSYAGGIVGYLYEGTVENTYNRGEIKSPSYAGGIAGGSMLAQRSAYSTYHYNTIRSSYSSGLVSANTYAGGIVGYDNPTNYSGGNNGRTNLYYDVSVLQNYQKPYNTIPSTTVSTQGLTKTMMFDDQLASKGFSNSVWTFRSIEGNYAYYPQLTVFADNKNEQVKDNSVLSVITNPFLGDGTKASPYIINTARDMATLAASITAEYSAEDIYYLVASGVAELDLTAVDFKPIGSNVAPFKGHFDGNYANFKVAINGTDYLGLFGYISLEATVERFSVTGTITGRNNIGGIVGYSNGFINHVYSKVEIIGNNNIGGITGVNNGELVNFYATGNINSSGSNSGGIVGFNSGIVTEGYGGGKVQGYQSVGGLIGFASNLEISDVYYNQTIIEFDDLIQGRVKPLYAVSNQPGLNTFSKLKEEITGLNVFENTNLSSDIWTLKTSTGFYDFYPQLKAFSSHANSIVKNNSDSSSRIIRFAYGNGTKQNPYLIRDEQDMKALSDITLNENLLNIYFKVMDGVEVLDLSDPTLGFVAIGHSNTRPFRGGFDGNFARIILSINRATTDYVGLFGYIGDSAIIQNIEITGQVTGRNYVGALSGYATNAQIMNIANHAVVKGGQYTAGLIGVITNVTISGSYNMADITSTSRDVGGLIGWGEKSTITNVFNYGSVTATQVVGGIIGYANNNIKIKYAFNRGSITSTITSGSAWVGGIIGASYNSTNLEDSYSAGVVTARINSNVGGIIGGVSGTTFEANAYYDRSVIDAYIQPTGYLKPTQAIANKLETENIKKLYKYDLIGLSTLKNFELDQTSWIFNEIDNLNAYYPGLKYFNDLNNKFKVDQLEAISTYVFIGEGTQNSPYMIISKDDMDYLSQLVRSGNTFEGIFFKVKDDIDLIDLTYGKVYQPIGTVDYPFEGSFDGLGTNFKLNINNNLDYQGLFGVLGPHATIKNLSVSGKVVGKYYVGSVAAVNQGLIESVYSSVNVTGLDNVGGIVGSNEGTINYAFHIGEVIGESKVGALIGNNENTINEGYASSTVFGKENLGALIGYSSGDEQNLYYNELKIEIYDHETLEKPVSAVSNKLEKPTVKGLPLMEMYTSSNLFTSTNWTYEKQVGFYAFFPQLKVFATSAYKAIKDYSKEVVKVDIFAEGDGTESNPYIIYNAFDMEAISNMTYAGYSLSRTYFKVADSVEYIDLRLTPNFRAIGYATTNFDGNFDGNNTVFELELNNTLQYQGLFGVIGKNGVVKNLGVRGSVTGGRIIGGVAGRNYGLLENVYNMAKVTGTEYVGGITGYSDGDVIGAFNHGEITGTLRYIGGIAGALIRNKVIQNAYNTADIYAIGNNQTYTEAGGIVGYLMGNLDNVYSTGGVFGKTWIGGIAGRRDSYTVTQNVFYLKDSSSFATNKVDTLTKATASVGNGSFDGINSIYQNQITSDVVFEASLKLEVFTLKQYKDFNAYLPQLKIFTDSTKLEVKNDSLESVTVPLLYGDGTLSNPYLIHNAYDFRALGIIVKDGYQIGKAAFEIPMSAYIDFKEISGYYTPVGTLDNPFNGSLNGNNVSIKLNVDKSVDYVGLFGVTGSDSYIYNLDLQGYVKGNNYVGALTGLSQGTLENIYASVEVVGNNYVGSIAGSSTKELLNVGSTGKVTGSSYVGGLFGFTNIQSIHNAYFIGEITHSGTYGAGLIGYAVDTEISESFTSGNINGQNNVAGFISYLTGSIHHAFSTMHVYGSSNVAGFIVRNEGIIEEVYVSGTIKGLSNVAGIAVLNNGTIDKAYFNKDFTDETLNAILNQSDTLYVASRTLDEMSANFPFGLDSSQMFMDESLYFVRTNFDFTQFLPELLSFKEHVHEKFRADSLKAITYQRIEGSGTKQDPFLIYDGFDMVEIDYHVKLGNDFSNKHFKVASGVTVIDLTLNDLNYSPIGSSETTFNGLFDGSNAIFKIQLNDDYGNNIGLFHTLGSTALVENLTINGELRGASYIGSVAGRNLGTIKNVTNYATTTGQNNDVGGIVGVNEGMIISSKNLGSVEALGSFVGGISGQNSGLISESYNRGSIKGFGNVGGITGYNHENLEYVFNTGSVTASKNIAGGIAGTSTGNIKQSYNSGRVHVDDSVAGGIVGALQGANITAVYNAGIITAKLTQAGGLIGNMDGGLVQNAYHFGEVYAKEDHGIIVGHLMNLDNNFNNVYYDEDLYNSKNHDTLTKPTKQVGINQPVSGIMPLDHGLMIGEYALSDNAMKLVPKTDFTTKDTDMNYSYYVQLSYFANHKDQTVKDLSEESVKTQTFMVGVGTESNPYLIRNESDWIAFAQSVKSGRTYENKFIKVSDEIHELNFDSQTSIYTFITVGTIDQPFEGIFDGNGVDIKVSIDNLVQGTALFAHLGTKGLIKHVSVSGFIKGGNNTAGIVGINQGFVEEVYNNATITGLDNVGGIAGLNLGTIQNVFNHGKVTGNNNVGGIVGNLDGTLTNTYNSGVILGKTNIGANVGLYIKGNLTTSYYDQTIIDAYRDVTGYIKPKSAIGSSQNADDLKGLDHVFMTGQSAIGSGETKLQFTNHVSIWTTSINIEDQDHYPQLRFFSINPNDHIKNRIAAATRNTLYTITFDERNEQTPSTQFKYVLNGEHFKLYIPEYFGWKFIGWYYDDHGLEIKITDENGLSIAPFSYESNIVLYAKWTEAYHTVQFIDGNNKVIESVEVRHGQLVDEPIGLTATKAKDQLFVYQFLGWDFNFNQTYILQPTKIYAKFEQLDRYYEVIYYDGDNEVYEIVKGEYSTYLSPLDKVPQKSYHDDIAYKFIKWDYNYNLPVTGMIEIYPIFEEVDRYYTVTFIKDGMIYHTEQVEYLRSALGPDLMPTKESTIDSVFEFIGWDQQFDVVTKDLIVHAIFEQKVREYTVIFKDGNQNTFFSQQVPYGNAAITPNGVPTKNPVFDKAYKFIGWDKDYSNITSDLVVNALFKEVERYYEVKFYDHENNLLSVQIVEYLQSAVAPNVLLVKEPTIQFIYEFTGWDKNYEKIEENLDVYPVFTQQLRPYTVTFLDGNGNVFEKVIVLYGESALIPEGIPRKDGIDDTGYKFVGWQNTYQNISSDQEVLPNFTEVYRWYYVTFKMGETILKTERVEYGLASTAPEITFEQHPIQGQEYYFIRWDKDFTFVESDLTVNLVYGSRLQRFIVTIINGDETTEEVVEWGKDVILPTPFKSPNAQITYEFVGWSHNGKQIKQDTTIIATFNEVYKYYEVRFFDGDGKLLKLEYITPGQDANPPQDVRKTKAEDKVYIFQSWDKDYRAVEENLNIYPIFYEVDRYYTVTFFDAFNHELSVQRIEYGNSASAPLPPSKVLEGRYLYNFIGWSEEFDEITSNLNIYPVYEEIEKQFKVTFIDGNGQIVKEVFVSYGLNATPPVDATKNPTEDEYYLFTGWSGSYINVIQDQIIYATFRKVDRWYQVNFIGKNNELLNTQVIEYGKGAYDPIEELGKQVIEVISDNRLEVIVEWDQPFDYITENLDVYAIYGEVDRYYTVTFYDYLGNVLEDHYVEYGDFITAPEAPVKPDELDYLFKFVKWSEKTTFVRSNLDIYPQYEAIKKRYTVRFYDGDGNLFAEQIVDYLKAATNPGTPTKLPTQTESFVFIRWDKDFSSIDNDLEIYPIFESTVRTFTVVFKDHEGNILKVEQVESGKSATAPTNIKEKPSTDMYEYKIRWSKDFTNVQSDLVVELYYEEVERIYYARFYNEFGELYMTISGTYGQTIESPIPPEKAMTNQYIYHFVGWSPTLDETLIKDDDYYPVYERTVRQYLVEFIDGNGDLYDSQLVPYGQTPKTPIGTPIKDANEQYYYVFRMWETTTAKVYQDLTIHAVFYRYLQEYQVTFIDEYGNILQVQMVQYGLGATEPDSSMIPDKPSTKEYVYIFAGWDKSFSYITQDTVIKTIYIATLRKYTYTFYDEDEVTVLKEITGAYGDLIIAPEPPKKAATESTIFEFVGWHIPVAQILTEDIFYIARYKEVPKTFRVIFIDGNGNLVHAETVEYGKDAKGPTIIPTKLPSAMYQYLFIGWDITFNHVTSDLIVTAQFERQLRDFQVTFIVGDEEIIEYVQYGMSAYNLVATPYLKGYRFIDWDQNLSFITQDTVTYGIFLPNNYYIEFSGGFKEGDIIPVTGSMPRIVATYDSEVTLPHVVFEREGYYFVGWQRQGESYVSYLDGQTIRFTEEGLKLEAIWLPVHYQIHYELDGGEAINPDSYTVEDTIVLQSAYKDDHQFIGWFLVIDDAAETQNKAKLNLGKSRQKLNEISGISEEPIEVIEPGTIIGEITLIARYEYDGYITIKEEYLFELGLYYANIVTTIPIAERIRYSDDNPTYLIGYGVKLNMTLNELALRFENEGLIFLDIDGNEISGDTKVATGQMIALKSSSGQIIDRVHVVLYGDTNGDGRITAVDSTSIINYVNGSSTSISGAKLLALDVNRDGRLTALDSTAILNHVSGSVLIH